jgi:pimeloyl-ACP methyl ester carboxylesterase
VLAFAVAILLASAHARGTWGVAYAPVDTREPKPAVVFLHGMWAGPDEACQPLERAATPFGFLVCPRGNAPFGDASIWAGTSVDAARSIRAALDAADGLAPGKLDRARGGTLVGYSNGAYFAPEVACAEPGRWPGLVLMSMKLSLDPARLRAAGVRRVVVASAEHDEAWSSMEALARGIEEAGVETRFVSLGPGSHTLPPDVGARMCDPIAWVRRADPALCGGTPAPPE